MDWGESMVTQREESTTYVAALGHRTRKAACGRTFSTPCYVVRLQSENAKCGAVGTVLDKSNTYSPTAAFRIIDHPMQNKI
jgi:hypothetical protein